MQETCNCRPCIQTAQNFSLFQTQTALKQFAYKGSTLSPKTNRLWRHGLLVHFDNIAKYVPYGILNGTQRKLRNHLQMTKSLLHAKHICSLNIIWKVTGKKKKEFWKTFRVFEFFKNLRVNVVKELFKEYLYLMLLAKVGKCKRPTGSTKVPALFRVFYKFFYRPPNCKDQSVNSLPATRTDLMLIRGHLRKLTIEVRELYVTFVLLI